MAVLGLQEEAGNGVPAEGCEQPSECRLSCMQWTACAEGRSLDCRRRLALGTEAMLQMCKRETGLNM